MNYTFKTQATMKEYNNKKWYIDSDIISEYFNANIDYYINAD